MIGIRHGSLQTKVWRAGRIIIEQLVNFDIGASASLMFWEQEFLAQRMCHLVTLSCSKLNVKIESKCGSKSDTERRGRQHCGEYRTIS
jgi:hypothetical protein